MFFGTTEHALDEKLRLVLPKKYREAFGGKAMLSLDFDGNLRIDTPESFQVMMKDILKLSPFDAKARKLRLMVFSKSYELTIDSHGRIMIPKAAYADAKLTPAVTLVGNYDHLELWDTAKLQDSLTKGEENYSCLAQSMLNEKTPD